MIHHPPAELSPVLAALQADPGDRLARAAVLDILRENGRGELDWPKRAKDAPPELRPFFFPERPWPVEKVRVQMQFWLDYGRALAAWWPVVLVDVADCEPSPIDGISDVFWLREDGNPRASGQPCWLPGEIFDMLEGGSHVVGDATGRIYCDYDGFKAARAALSAACIRWARIPQHDPLTK
jgi:hypothetical protein